jgi:hypothetical protein
MTVITMSRTEIDRMGVLHDLADGRIKIAEASTLMGAWPASGISAGEGIRQAWP